MDEETKAPEQPEGAPEMSAPAQTFTQADIDRAVEAERARWQAEQSEAERLSKLTNDEREAEKNRKRLEKLEEREKSLARSQLEFEVRQQLFSAGLPTEFSAFLAGADAEATKANFDAFKKAFSEAVKQAAAAKLASAAPKDSGPAQTQDSFLKGFSGK